MNFISTNRSNPCPICTDIKGKCRSKDTNFTIPNHSTIVGQQFLCMAVRQDSNGFKFTGETSDCAERSGFANRLWGKFISFDLSQSLSGATRKSWFFDSGDRPNEKATEKS